MKLDKIIIIGSGLAGSCLANLLANKNKLVDVYEIKDHIGGNIYDYYNEHGVLVHKYGPHIFHTNNEDVWNFITKFGDFESYINQVLVSVDSKLIPLPINLDSIKLLFNKEFDDFLKEVNQKNLFNKSLPIIELKQLLTDESSIKIINYIYDNVYKNYTAKMWGIKPEDIDQNVLKRVKINLNYDWNYFINDKYQAIPRQGYSHLINNMLSHKNIKIHLKTNGLSKLSFKNNKVYFDGLEYDLVVYTGMLDELFNYKFGNLDYRSLKIVFETYNIDSYQQKAVINYPSDLELTRITEYKKLTYQNIKNITTISKEFPGRYDPKNVAFNVPFYPINDQKNESIKEQYMKYAQSFSNLLLVGRLSEYKYYDMDDIIEKCLIISKAIN